MWIWTNLADASILRNVHLGLCPSSTCQAAWRMRQRTDILPTPSSCIGEYRTCRIRKWWLLPLLTNLLFSLLCLLDVSVILWNHRLPVPRPGEVLGLVGTNGIGKSTALKILSGKQKPNLGKYDVSKVEKFIVSLLKSFFVKCCHLCPVNPDG